MADLSLEDFLGLLGLTFRGFVGIAICCYFGIVSLSSNYFDKNHDKENISTL